MNTLNFKQTDFRLYLQQELVDRCRANPKYSLRAFARRLHLEASFLSKVLSGQRRVTTQLVQRLAPSLELSPADLKTFTGALPKRKKKSSTSHDGEGVSDVVSFQQLTMDTFQMISDWYHYAILELVSLKDFQSSPKWISAKLGISVTEAQIAIERLLRLEMLTQAENGTLLNASGSHTTIGNEFTAIAFRKLQKQVLDQAKTALEEVPLELRDQSSMTMAISSTLMPEAKKILRKFRRDFCDDLQNRQLPRDHVYQLNISFFPITKGVQS